MIGEWKMLNNLEQYLQNIQNNEKKFEIEYKQIIAILNNLNNMAIICKDCSKLFSIFHSPIIFNF